MPHRPDITFGFLPFADAAIPIVAAARGFADDQGVTLRLMRQESVRFLRDRMATGHLQAAQMPAPLLLASNLGLSPLFKPLLAPMALGHGGDAITVSTTLFDRLLSHGLTPDLGAAEAGRALCRLIRKARDAGEPPLRIAVAQRLCGEAFMLRYWLGASGIDPDRDITLVSLAQELMVDALNAGLIQGFSTGEPWNTMAVRQAAGRILTTSSAIWRNGPGKMLAVARDWALERPDVLERLVRALYRSSEWCANPANTEELAGILAASPHLGVDGEALLPALIGHLPMAGDPHGHDTPVEDFLVLNRNAAAFPWQSHALWFYSQMVRWGQCSHTVANAETARLSYRPDICRHALRPLFAPLPGANLKLEGSLSEPQYVGTSHARLMLGPDRFFDGSVFDPDRLDAYITAQRTA